MTKCCQGFPQWAVKCQSPVKTSSQYCGFHRWWLDNYASINRAIREYKEGEAFKGLETKFPIVKRKTKPSLRS